jgi:twitching motility protein PilU
MELANLLRTLVDEKGSDLFVSVGIQPAIKVNGKLRRLGDVELDEREVLSLVRQTMTEERYQVYVDSREANFAITCPGIGRFRVSAFWQQDFPGCSIRRIETVIPTCEELFLPLSIKELAMAKRGLILFVGATGAGKSTTQAAMIGYRNRHANDHILTIEDPVEFVHQHDRCLITQREVGSDTLSFDEGLKRSINLAMPRWIENQFKDMKNETTNFYSNFTNDPNGQPLPQTAGYHAQGRQKAHCARLPQQRGKSL